MTVVDLLVNGVFTGIGTGIGSYVATTYAIKHIKVAEDTIKAKVIKDEKSGRDNGPVPRA